MAEKLNILFIFTDQQSATMLSCAGNAYVNTPAMDSIAAAGTGFKDLSVSWEDNDSIDDIWLPATKFCDNPFVFYYVRVVQQDGEVAWASPIWIDP